MESRFATRRCRMICGNMSVVYKECDTEEP